MSTRIIAYRDVYIMDDNIMYVDSVIHIHRPGRDNIASGEETGFCPVTIAQQ